VYDVFTRAHLAVSLFIFGCHDEEGKCRRIKHLGQASGCCDSCDRHPVEFVNGQSEAIFEKIL